MTLIVLILCFPLLAEKSEISSNSAYVYAVDTDTSTQNPTPEITPPPPVLPSTIDISKVKNKKIPRQVYDGKAKKPAVKLTVSGSTLKKGRDYTLTYKNNKNPGTARIIVKGKGKYKGKKEIKFKIYLKTPTGLRASNDKKKITVSWRAVPNVTGYRIYLASNSKFTKNKRMKLVKSPNVLSFSFATPDYKRDYYMKIRTYKTIKGKNYYGPVSKPIKIKTKNVKWIEVDLSKQKMYLKNGKKNVKVYTVSTGKAATPTIKGTFYTYQKIVKHDMIGGWNPYTQAPEYITRNVMWSTYFDSGGYAFHAAYWHNNFGTPMSHGCVNMKTPEAKFLYNWAPIGTKVVIHK